MTSALISLCLLGINCRYDGGHSQFDFRKLLSNELCLIPICPEQLGGLPTPRCASFLVGGNGFDVLDGKAKVINKDGVDVTGNFVKGAFEALNIVRSLGIEICYLKDRSPSCGVNLRSCDTENLMGPGVTAALLIREGVPVVEVKAKGLPLDTH